MWVKDTVPRLSSWVSPLAWPEIKVTIFFWPRSWHRVVAHSCQTAFTNLFSHSTRVWLKCSWIVINMHCRITEEHGRSSLLQKISIMQVWATLQKARRFTESRTGITRCVELVYAFIFICNLVSLSVNLEILFAPCCFQMRERHRCYR